MTRKMMTKITIAAIVPELRLLFELGRAENASEILKKYVFVPESALVTHINLVFLYGSPYFYLLYGTKHFHCINYFERSAKRHRAGYKYHCQALVAFHGLTEYGSAKQYFKF